MKLLSFGIDFFACLLITVAELFWIDHNPLSIQNLTAFSILLVANLSFQLFLLYLKDRTLVSFFSAFIIFFYLFHFGQVIMLGLFPTYQYDYLNYVSTYMRNSPFFSKTMEVCLMTVNMFFLGGIIIKRTTPRIEQAITSIHKLDIGKRLFFILLPFRVVLDIMQFSLALTGGYHAALTVSLPGIISAFANMWYACIPLYYLELTTNNGRKHFLIIIIIYLFLSMLSGGRGHQIVGIVGLFIVVIQLQRNVSLIKWGRYITYAIIGLFFIDIIYDLRAVGIEAFFNSNAYNENSNNHFNIFLETIGTFGETIYTPFLVIEGYGSVFKPFFGECFIKSFVAIIPDVFGNLKDLNNEAIFSKMLGVEATIGGSFAGDMYYNFGNLYWLFSFFLGILFYKVSSLINYAIKNYNFSHLYLAIPFAILSLWWVRDSVGNLTRQVVWIALLILLLKTIRRK